MPESFGPEDFAASAAVSRETLDELVLYGEMLAASPHNLVSPSTIPDLWHRHMWDSAQLVPLIPKEATTLADLGSGAGFPGLVLAILLKDRLRVRLYEATKKKADFLASVADRLNLKVAICNERIEAAEPKKADVITARAFAPLPQLLAYAHRFQGPKTVCLFLKGQSHTAELTDARRNWNMNIQKHPSQTHPLGVVLEIRDLVHVSSRKSSRR
jgi:16S rRNA (guanine527-N7)-methyltransferase